MIANKITIDYQGMIPGEGGWRFPYKKDRSARRTFHNFGFEKADLVPVGEFSLKRFTRFLY